MLRRARARFKRHDAASAPLSRDVAPPDASPPAASLAAPPLPKLAPVEKPRTPFADLPPLASGAERREHKRKSLSVAVDLHTESNFFGGRTRDISVGGLFIETDVALDIGAHVVVNLWLGGARYELASEVMWALTDASGTRGVGVRFVHLPEKALRAIATFIDERAPEDLDVEEIEPPPALPALPG